MPQWGVPLFPICAQLEGDGGCVHSGMGWRDGDQREVGDGTWGAVSSAVQAAVAGCGPFPQMPRWLAVGVPGTEPGGRPTFNPPPAALRLSQGRTLLWLGPGTGTPVWLTFFDNVIHQHLAQPPSIEGLVAFCGHSLQGGGQHGPWERILRPQGFSSIEEKLPGGYRGQTQGRARDHRAATSCQGL